MTHFTRQFIDKHREMYKPYDDSPGYVFEFLRAYGRAFALVRDGGTQGIILWRTRGPSPEWIQEHGRAPGINETFEDATYEYSLNRFHSMEELLVHEFPEWWTMQLRARALSARPPSDMEIA